MKLKIMNVLVILALVGATTNDTAMTFFGPISVEAIQSQYGYDIPASLEDFSPRDVYVAMRYVIERGMWDHGQQLLPMFESMYDKFLRELLSDERLKEGLLLTCWKNDLESFKQILNDLSNLDYWDVQWSLNFICQMNLHDFLMFLCASTSFVTAEHRIDQLSSLVYQNTEGSLKTAQILLNGLDLASIEDSSEKRK